MDAFEKWWEIAHILNEDGYPEYTHFNACELAFRAGMQAATAKLKERDDGAHQNLKDWALKHKRASNAYLLGRGDEAHGAYIAILAEADK